MFPYFENRSGRVETIEVFSETYGTNRTVEVYLPPSYDEERSNAREYPLLFMQDGANLYDPSAPFGYWDLATSLDELMVHGTTDGESIGHCLEIVVVAPHQTDNRMWEYTPSDGGMGGGGADEFLDSLLDDLLPIIERDYRVTGTTYGIAGSSLGGLLSLYASWTRPETFTLAGVFSPSLWWEDEEFLDEIRAYTGPKKAIVIYLDAGTDGDSYWRVESLNDSLSDRSEDTRYVSGEDLWCIIGEGHEHNEAAWAVRSPWALHFLYSDPARVQDPASLVVPLRECE